ncbi:SUKH-4 family immunity protein [Streptomyces sp. NBC_00654]|uniref:SUKH-4 family immunity protein n=1 Tax=Streptomyces sp. NBC_00654 TaxID=2975799 RepID=UPI00224F3F81|nr:SUKH-4 family immunity protein [Streptomyces sp. NBC_00654]MCX4966503.1 SUKH-4 family immunity protein [Streptomyces sp. NBC_00654]
MIFEVGDEEPRPGVPESRWVRASPEVLAGVVRRPQDLQALCGTGFPQRPFAMAPALAADDCTVGGSRLVDLGDTVEIAEREFGDLLLFGAVQGWYLFLHLGDGTVYAYPDEVALFPGDFRPVHTDLSSLRRVLELLLRQQLSAEGESAESWDTPYAELARFTDRIRAEFAAADPGALSPEGPWPAFFRDIEDGLYSTYYARPPRASADRTAYRPNE